MPCLEAGEKTQDIAQNFLTTISLSKNNNHNIWLSDKETQFHLPPIQQEKKIQVQKAEKDHHISPATACWEMKMLKPAPTNNKPKFFQFQQLKLDS